MTEPASRTAVAGHAGVLLTFVQRCRHRLVWTAFVRYACLTCGAGMAAALVHLVVADSTIEWWVAAAIVSVCLAVAAALAAFRSPSLRSSGAAVDARLGLADVVVAGLESSGGNDPVSELVVRHAAGSVRSVLPRELFPVRLNFLHRAAAIVFVIGTIAFSAAPFRAGDRIDVAAARQGVGGAPPPADARGQRDSDIAGELADAVPSVGSSAGGATSQRAPEDVRATDTPGVESAAERQDGANSGQEADANAGSPGARDARSENGSSGPGAATAGGADALDGASAAGGRSDAAAGAGRGASAATAVAANGAGGITGGRLSGPGQEPPASIRTGTSYAARYRDARAQAEAALTRDEVPPQYRQYVRRYFSAIGQTEP